MENKEEKNRDSKGKNETNKLPKEKVNDESKRKQTTKKFGSGLDEDDNPGTRK
jgi:hypothetical protein